MYVPENTHGFPKLYSRHGLRKPKLFDNMEDAEEERDLTGVMER